jgi:hypothetical protein
MAYNTGAAVGMAAAIERQRQLMFEEEEQMTSYTDDELQNDWEFKIVRANRGVFGNFDELKKLVEEENRAGWILLEKLDNSRIRFKRRRSAQANDPQLISYGVDPYRTHYGMSPNLYAALIVIIFLAVPFGFLILMMAFSNSH